VAKAVKEIEQDIRALSSEEKLQLLRTLLADLDAPADANVERAWLETSQRRYRELVEGKVQGVPGPLVFQRLRARLMVDESGDDYLYPADIFIDAELPKPVKRAVLQAA
jgi:hypothetical protein